MPLTPQQAFDRNKVPRGRVRCKKVCHVGVPAIFALELACQHINSAFSDSFGCYVVGSALERPDWRDVDVVCILGDDEFKKLFPDVARVDYCTWEHDPRWLLLTISLSKYLSDQAAVPVDFKFQPQTWANEHHPGRRNAIGMRYASPRPGVR
jgi:hypothetical protein